MSSEVASTLSWTFMQEIETPTAIHEMLIDGEYVVGAYKTVRDVAAFTNRRLIVRDAQGITGKKVETYSLPYSAINMWSMENAGHIDLNTEIELWTRAGNIKVKMNRKVDVTKIDKIIAEYVCA